MPATSSNVAELIKETWETPFTDAMDRDLTLFQRFKRDSGTAGHFEWKVHYAGNDSVGSYAEGDSLPTAGVQSYAEARSPYYYNWGTIEVTGQAQAFTKGEGGFMESLANETKEVLEDLKNELNSQLLANSKASSTDMDGLGVIVADTGTYAEIDRSTDAYWQSYVNDNGGSSRALQIAQMQDVMTNLLQPDRKSKPSVLMGALKHWYDYGNLLTDIRRFVDTQSLDGGYKALDFEGIPFIWVPDMPTGNIFILDEKEWCYSVSQNFETVEKDVQKDARRFVVTHYANLICKHPGRQGRISDLS